MERAIIYLRANGKCQICGIDLPEDWQVDHIAAYSKGGTTYLRNAQALCRKCNLKKGAK